MASSGTFLTERPMVFTRTRLGNFSRAWPKNSDTACWSWCSNPSCSGHDAKCGVCVVVEVVLVLGGGAVGGTGSVVVV